jgi:flagellar export protein FliJ
MKKFVFTLEKVLNYKQQILEVKKNEMAQLQASLSELEEKIRALELRSGELDRELADRLRGGLATWEAAHCKDFQNELIRRIRLLCEKKEQLLELISLKRQEIVQMNGDISGLERLKDRQWKDYTKLCGKEQELAVEEFVGRTRCSAG